MIRYADKELMPHLRTLWKSCFGEGDTYLDFVFTKLLRSERVLALTDEEGLPRAMLCMEPMELACRDGSRISSVYVYAVATDPAWRGKGLSTVLMEEVHQRLAEAGYSSSVLVPASESLFRFYGDRGYQVFSGINKAVASADQMPKTARECVLSTGSLEQMDKLRDKLFGDGRVYVRWSREWLGKIGQECQLIGGEALRFSCAGQSGYAVCYRDQQGNAVVKEVAVPEGICEDFYCALHRRLAARKYTFYLREDCNSKFTNTILPFSMIRWYDKEKMRQVLEQTGAPAYITHVLD